MPFMDGHLLTLQRAFIDGPELFRRQSRLGSAAGIILGIWKADRVTAAYSPRLDSSSARRSFFSTLPTLVLGSSSLNSSSVGSL